MLLFFGTRSTQLDTRIIRENISCDHCNTQNSFRLTTHGTYFHVFFIPIVTLGKKHIVECQHCKKTYYKEELPHSLEVAIEKSYEKSSPKKGYWHSLGCLSVVSLFAFSFLFSFLIWAFSGVADFFNPEESNIDEYISEEKITKDIENENAVWLDNLKAKMYTANYFPDIEKDPISYGFSNCLEAHLNHADKGDISYRTTVKDNKILILIGPVHIGKLKDKQRDSLYNKIDVCIDNVLKFKSYERYIGVFKGEKIYMQKTPKGFVKDSTANKSELLKDFFVSNSTD